MPISTAADRAITWPRFFGDGHSARSEEHTSELQSQSNLVCRLLLEKKKHDSVHSLPIENQVIATREQAFKAISKTNHFPAELIRCQHYRAQNRMKPRTIATARQRSD